MEYSAAVFGWCFFFRPNGPKAVALSSECRTHGDCQQRAGNTEALVSSRSRSVALFTRSTAW